MVVLTARATNYLKTKIFPIQQISSAHIMFHVDSLVNVKMESVDIYPSSDLKIRNVEFVESKYPFYPESIY